jgi:hypothetical protein
VVDANVVCRQLGCGLALPVPRPLAFGQGRGPILLDNVECLGQEAALSECGSRGWGIHNCFHYEDVAVLCNGEQRTVTQKGRQQGCRLDKKGDFPVVRLFCSDQAKITSLPSA